MHPEQRLFLPFLLAVLGCGESDDSVPGDDAAPPSVVYLNFSDGTESIQFAEADDATTNESRICHTANVPAWNGAPSCGGRESCRRAVADLIQRYWLPFNVVFTTQRPTVGDYSMVTIGAPSGLCAFGVVGLAMLDCGNTGSRDIVFAFSCLEPKECARVISQELGHAFGLTHTDHSCDLMAEQASRCAKPHFADEDMLSDQGDLSCGLATQNSFRMLLETLGSWPPTRPKPVDW